MEPCILGSGYEVMNAMSKFVEEGHNFVMLQ